MVNLLTWETINVENEINKNDNTIDIVEITHRAMVPGGWIIKTTTTYTDVSPIQRTESCCFVPFVKLEKWDNDWDYNQGDE